MITILTAILTSILVVVLTLAFGFTYLRIRFWKTSHDNLNIRYTDALQSALRAESGRKELEVHYAYLQQNFKNVLERTHEVVMSPENAHQITKFLVDYLNATIAQNMSPAPVETDPKAN